MAVELSITDVAARIAARRREAGPAAFVGVSLPPDFDPTVLLDDPASHDVVASYERPDRGYALVAAGEAGRVDVQPGEPLSAARRGARSLLRGGLVADVPALRPRLLGGFRFNPHTAPEGDPWAVFGGGALLLPRLLFVRDEGEAGVVLAPGLDARDAAARVIRALEARPGRPRPAAALRLARPIDERAWLASVANIAAEVRAGLYEKAVLATTKELKGDLPIDTGETLGRLRRWYPDCHLFSVRAGGSTFLGASPELLVSLSGGSVRALGLAGSTPRGGTPDEDERLGRELLGSAKNRIEHETVVRAIREALADATDQLRAPNQPLLRRLRNIQHLATEIVGRVRAGVDVLDLVERLHPTPAVCGWPRDVARRVIDAHEGFDRGWYAGPVGFLDAAGEGEFAVALRSAVVRGPRAWLFAGNGIMGDSDPETELAEVRLKFRPLIEALGASPALVEERSA